LFSLEISFIKDAKKIFTNFCLLRKDESEQIKYNQHLILLENNF
jgi:hypothetical protein